jgi:chromosome segregation ATPase
MRARSGLVAVAALAAALAPALARSDAASETRLRDALRTSMAQLRTLEDEKAQWQSTEAALRKELEALRRQPAAADRGDRKAADLRRRLVEGEEAAARLKRSLDKCQADAREAEEAGRSRDEDHTRLTAEAAALRERLAASEARNVRMFQVATAVLDWIDRLGTGAAFAAREPFLGLKRVELENAAQDHRDKVLEQKAGR